MNNNELKPGYKTTEFIALAVAMLILVAMTFNAITAEQGVEIADAIIVAAGWFGVGNFGAAYARARGAVKQAHARLGKTVDS